MEEKRDIWKTSFSLLSNLFPNFFVAPVIVFRKLGDVISFQSASYINVGKEPSKTALKQMAMCISARKWEQPFVAIFFFTPHAWYNVYFTTSLMDLCGSLLSFFLEKKNPKGNSHKI